ncbi:MAG TPA: GNAT family protein [Ruania sp.]|nr:GNAT family protein [Ruania sp.]
MELRSGAVRLRPLRRRDRDAWQRLRRRNMGWLLPWEATSPDGTVPQASFTGYVRQLNRAARQDTGYAFVVEYRGELVGQVSVAGVSRGSLQSASIGYWISEHVAGRGIIPTAVAMVADYCFTDLGLHRVEINIRPENSASLRVVEKLGFRDEGVRRAYLHIQGQWADHRTFALTVDEAAPGLLKRWLTSRGSAPPTHR